MNDVLFNIVVIGVLFLVGWIAIFSSREKIKLIQGIILLFLSVISYLLMIGLQKSNNEMVYIGYLALVLINIFVMILVKLIQDCFNQEQAKEND